MNLKLCSYVSSFVQTRLHTVDAPINSGNSGGPLIDLDGRVVGLISAKLLFSDGVGFAVPIDAALRVLKQLQDHGRVLRPYIGIRLLQLNQALADQIRASEPGRIPRGTNAGLLIAQVQDGSPAAHAGLQSGDVILQLRTPAGVEVQHPSVNQLLDVLSEAIGGTVAMEVEGPQGARCLRVRVEEAPTA